MRVHCISAWAKSALMVTGRSCLDTSLLRSYIYCIQHRLGSRHIARCHPPPSTNPDLQLQPAARGLHQAVDNDKTMGVKFCSRGDCVRLCRDHCGHKSWDRLPNYNGWSHTREVVTRAVNEISRHFSQYKDFLVEGTTSPSAIGMLVCKFNHRWVILKDSESQ